MHTSAVLASELWAKVREARTVVALQSFDKLQKKKEIYFNVTLNIVTGKAEFSLHE